MFIIRLVSHETQLNTILKNALRFYIIVSPFYDFGLSHHVVIFVRCINNFMLMPSCLLCDTFHSVLIVPRTHCVF